MNAKAYAQRKLRAFTLIELLVVIAIIGILAALLLPVLARAKVKTQGACCLSNLKQLQLAWTTYSSDHSDKLVPSGDLNCLVQNPNDPRAREGGTLSQWVLGSMKVSPTWTNQVLIQKGLLWPYVKALGVYKCPADPKTDRWPARGGVPTVRSVAMNCWLNPIAPYPGGRVMHKMFDITKPSPSRCWVLLDQCPWCIDDGWFVCLPSGNNWVDCPAPFHNGGPIGTICFGDGHAELKKYTDKNMIASQTINVPADPKSADLAWLQERSTVPQ